MPHSFRNTLFRRSLMAAAVVFCAAANGQSILLDHRTATYGHPATGNASAAPTGRNVVNKTLVTAKALPAEGDFQIIGRIDVYSRWFGGTGKAKSLLGEKARSLGANAVFEASVWLAPAFPATLAPHGTGIAVRITNQQLLEQLADASSTWE